MKTPHEGEPLLTYEDATHEYRLDGKRVPSVTQVLECAGIIPKYDGDPWYGERGAAVHRACEMLDKGEMAVEDLTEEHTAIAGFVRSYALWVAVNKPEYTRVEVPFACTKTDCVYAGRVDRTMKHKVNGQDCEITLDLKTSSPKWYHDHQLALYAYGLGLSPMRAGLYLHEDGEIATLKEYTKAETLTEALAAVKVFWAVHNHRRDWQ